MGDSRTYRADIDGLRAVAVIAVVLYHYGFTGIPGGFIGVDVFFVISGYLITSLLFQDIERDRFSILGFYDRRIRRILPALLVMLLTVGSIGSVLLFPGDYVGLADSAKFAAVGLSNLYFYGHTGYFDQSAEFLPLLHTWSLGVEEQFYVVWPALLVGISIAARRRKRLMAAVIAILLALSFAFDLYTLATDPKASFYFPHTRAWELALGAILVFVPPLPEALTEIATAAGLALIVTGLFTISMSQPFPGWNALLPCCGSALVIWPKVAEALTASALGLLRWIGLISYSLYLWHWPIWVFYRVYKNNGIPTPTEAAALIALAIAISWLSLRFIEQPFRRLRRPYAVTVAAGLVTAGCVAAVAILINRAEGFPSRIPPSLLAMKSVDEMWKWDCRKEAVVTSIMDECIFGANWQTAKTNGVLWGDSHAGHFAPLIEPFADDRGASILLVQACPSILDGIHASRYLPAYPKYNSDCAGVRTTMLQTLRDPKIGLVILASAWSNFTPDLYTDVDPAGRSIEKGARVLEDALDGTVADIERPGRRIAILGTVPQWSDNPVPCELAQAPLLRAHCIPPTLSRTQSITFQQPTYDAIARVAGRHQNTIAILPGIPLCRGDTCLSKLNGDQLYRDGSHIRRNLSEATRRELGELIGLPRIFGPDASTPTTAANPALNQRQ